MKLKTLAAALLSSASLFATAQSLDLGVLGDTRNGTFFDGSSIFLNESSGIGGSIINSNAASTTIGTFAPNVPAVFSLTTLTLGAGGLLNEFTPLQLDGYRYSFLFFKVHANNAPLLAGAKLSLTLSETGGDVPGSYSFLNGSTSLDLADNQYWRGFSVLSTNSTLAGNDGVFATLLGGAVGSTLAPDLANPGFFNAISPAATTSTPQVDAIYATLIRATFN